MDKNKLEKLRNLKYSICKCCGLCEHARFFSDRDIWGTCMVHKYEHLKHTNKVRQLSINQFGYCGNFKLNKDIDLNNWIEFLEDGKV